MEKSQPANGNELNMAQANITMYESMLCGYCRAAKRLFANKGWEYTSIVVDGEPALRADMEAKSGRHTVPQIFIGEQHVGGYDDIALLEHNGELDALVNSTPE